MWAHKKRSIKFEKLKLKRIDPKLVKMKAKKKGKGKILFINKT